MKWIQSWLLDKSGSFDCGCFIGVGVQHFQRSLQIHLKLSLCCICRGGNVTQIPHTSNYSSARVILLYLFGFYLQIPNTPLCYPCILLQATSLILKQIPTTSQLLSSHISNLPVFLITHVTYPFLSPSPGVLVLTWYIQGTSRHTSTIQPKILITLLYD